MNLIDNRKENPQLESNKQRDNDEAENMIYTWDQLHYPWHLVFIDK